MQSNAIQPSGSRLKGNSGAQLSEKENREEGKESASACGSFATSASPIVVARHTLYYLLALASLDSWPPEKKKLAATLFLPPPHTSTLLVRLQSSTLFRAGEHIQSPTHLFNSPELKGRLITTSLNEDVVDKIRDYRLGYSNRPCDSSSFMTTC